jgi:hypothetical protein
LINFDVAVQKGYNIQYIDGHDASTSFWTDTGSNKGYCYIRCHNKKHNPKSYRRDNEIAAVSVMGISSAVGISAAATNLQASMVGSAADSEPAVRNILSTGTVNIPFRCTSCHDPHGKSLADVGGSGTQANGRTDNYRLLKNVVVKSWESTTNYGTGVTKSYTRAAWQDSGMTDFCTSCHADYKATTPATGTENRPSGTGWAHAVNVALDAAGTGAHTNLNASNYKLPVEETSFSKWYWVDYSNPTASGAGTVATTSGAGSYDATNDKITCTTCHNAHGSVATDSQAYASNATGDPSLLRFNDRTVCQSCHAKGI